MVLYDVKCPLCGGEASYLINYVTGWNCWDCHDCGKSMRELEDGESYVKPIIKCQECGKEMSDDEIVNSEMLCEPCNKESLREAKAKGWYTGEIADDVTQKP